MTNKNLPTVTILGCGYVGLTTAALLANSGIKVYAVEPDTIRLEIIRHGRSFFFETGLDEMVNAASKSGMLIATDSYKQSVPNSSVIFSCVGTPDNPDGSSNLTYVFAAAKEATKYIKPGSIYVQKSTVPVGTGDEVTKIFQKNKVSAVYVSNPEFLREGTAIADTLWPDRVVVGSNNKAAASRVIDLYKLIENKAESLAKIASVTYPKKVPVTSFVRTTRSSAELIKVTANAFLAMKVTFANSIAKLADAVGADVMEIMDAVGSDQRIGKAFLNAGRGYGGGCFPKDVSGLIRSANDHGVGMEIMETVSEVNDSMPHYIVNKAEKILGGFSGKKIAILGLTFKAGTSDSRRSPAVTIADTLVQKGALVKAYDPEGMEEATQYGMDKRIELCDSLDDAVRGTDCIFVATEWPVFRNMDADRVAKVSGANLLVDCMNCIVNRPKVMSYIGVGISSQ